MAHKLNDARRSLMRAKEAAEARLQEIEQERREIKASLKSLDAAMKALNGPKGRTSPQNRSVIGNTTAGQGPKQA
jgi:chromosome segregation ATPase